MDRLIENQTSDGMKRLTALAAQLGRPLKVLIVDDEAWVREVLQEFCAFTDSVAVDVVGSASEAIKAVGDSTYDLVTLDLIMPNISGLEAIASIKEKQPRLPILVITGNATDRVIMQAGVDGACRVLHKPVKYEQFVAAMASSLAKA